MERLRDAMDIKDISVKYDAVKRETGIDPESSELVSGRWNDFSHYNADGKSPQAKEDVRENGNG